mgnify:CR=1 FL=1
MNSLSLINEEINGTQVKVTCGINYSNNNEYSWEKEFSKECAQVVVDNTASGLHYEAIRFSPMYVVFLFNR